MTISKFRDTILSWYKKNKRSLPWRKTRDPYRILVSEIMLQQTQVLRVLPKYKEFLKAFPTVQDLATAHDKTLLAVWQGMGYWRRALFLKKTAQLITETYRGEIPSSLQELMKLPGVGPYTAGAVACFAFNSSEAFIDTNIRRVYLHFFFPLKEKVSDKEILPLAQQAITALPSPITPKEWHSALFDYGSLVIKDRSVNKRSLHYAKQSEFEGSLRFFRAKVLRFVLNAPDQKASLFRIGRMLKEEETPYDPQSILGSLVKDGLLKKHHSTYSL
ncbi:MAG: A/G-specific adenine glycosylase [bacterium]|nr:A/G-specific adenine glycosylase [bacterium]